MSRRVSLLVLRFASSMSTYGLTTGFLADDTLNVNDVFETVYRGDFALLALVGTTDNGDFVILSDWNRADLGSMSELQMNGVDEVLTLYFSRSSLLKGALMMVRLTLDGASK